MKTPLRLLPLCILVTAAAPLASAQNIAGRVGTVDRSVERLTLLPGPTLLSPGHAPQATPNIAIVSE
jgi:hypothetical protein